MTALKSVFSLGPLVNNLSGLMAGTLFGCVFLSLALIELEQCAAGRAIGELSFSSKHLG